MKDRFPTVFSEFSPFPVAGQWFEREARETGARSRLAARRPGKALKGLLEILMSATSVIEMATSGPMAN
jgi:hypothetical protein